MERIIKPHKYVVIDLFISIFFLLIPVAISISGVLVKIDYLYASFFLYPHSIFIVINMLIRMQSYVINDDGITVRNVFGVVNCVKWDSIIKIELIDAPVHTSGDFIKSLKFIDHTNHPKDDNTFINKSTKYVRVVYSIELENEIKSKGLLINKDSKSIRRFK